MYYKHFLDLLAQLQTQKCAKLFIEDHCLEFTWDVERKKCRVLTKVFSGQEGLPAFIYNLLSSRGDLRWNEEGMIIKADFESGNVYLIQDVEPVFKFIYIRAVLESFIKESFRWRNFFHMHQAKTSFLFS